MHYGMPFGKHKGEDFEDVVADDPGYVKWLFKQDWLQEDLAIRLSEAWQHMYGYPHQPKQSRACRARRA
jgi:hypothetical protein